MNNKILALLLGLLIVLAIATIFIVLYASAAAGKIIAGIFLVLIIGIMIVVNQKK